MQYNIYKELLDLIHYLYENRETIELEDGSLADDFDLWDLSIFLQALDECVSLELPTEEIEEGLVGPPLRGLRSKYEARTGKLVTSEKVIDFIKARDRVEEKKK